MQKINVWMGASALLGVAFFLTGCGNNGGTPTVSQTPAQPISEESSAKPAFTNAEEALNSNLPGIIFTDGKMIKNQAFIENEQLNEIKGEEFRKSEENQLSAQAICSYTIYNCTTSTQWTYKGDIKGSRSLYTFIYNNGGTATLNGKITATVSNSSTISGGFGQSVIKASVGWTSTSQLSVEVPYSVPSNKTSYIYTWQVGQGGYGTQYKYPSGFVSCSSAGAECISSNFSVSAYKSLGYEVQTR